MTPETLREFAENCGWRYLNITLSRPWKSPDGLPCIELPDFERDLNACFEALEWFCKEARCEWDVKSASHRLGYSCTILGIDASLKMVRRADGKEVTEAIIFAVNAAAKLKSSDKSEGQ